jgi:hypothetical protein
LGYKNKGNFHRLEYRSSRATNYAKRGHHPFEKLEIIDVTGIDKKSNTQPRQAFHLPFEAKMQTPCESLSYSANKM